MTDDEFFRRVDKRTDVSARRPARRRVIVGQKVAADRRRVEWMSADHRGPRDTMSGGRMDRRPDDLASNTTTMTVDKR